MGNLASYSRDLIKLCLQFIGVAFCSIPATGAYFLALRGGANNVLARALSLGLGAILAYCVWRLLDKRIWRPSPVSVLDFSPPADWQSPMPLVVIGSSRVTGSGTIAAAAAIAFLYSTAQPPMTLPSPTFESIAEGTSILSPEVINVAP